MFISPSPLRIGNRACRSSCRERNKWRSRLSSFSSRRPHRPTFPSGESSPLLKDFVNQLCRIVRSRVFIQQVTRQVKWPYLRFSGIVFMRSNIDDGLADGIPPQFLELQNSADTLFIDIPPGILQRACKQLAGQTLPQTQGWIESKWCAVFEIFGETRETANISRKIMADFKEDFDSQLKAWSDRRLSLRTETDLSQPNGHELYHEDYLSRID